MTIDKRRKILNQEIANAEKLLVNNIENYSIKDFMPSFSEIVKDSPAVLSENPKEVVKVASFVSDQIFDEDHMVNRILHYLKQGLFVASLLKRS